MQAPTAVRSACSAPNKSPIILCLANKCRLAMNIRLKLAGVRKSQLNFTQANVVKGAQRRYWGIMPSAAVMGYALELTCRRRNAICVGQNLYSVHIKMFSQKYASLLNTTVFLRGRGTMVMGTGATM